MPIEVPNNNKINMPELRERMLNLALKITLNNKSDNKSKDKIDQASLTDLAEVLCNFVSKGKG